MFKKTEGWLGISVRGGVGEESGRQTQCPDIMRENGSQDVDRITIRTFTSKDIQTPHYYMYASLPPFLGCCLGRFGIYFVLAVEVALGARVVGAGPGFVVIFFHASVYTLPEVGDHGSHPHQQNDELSDSHPPNEMSCRG